MRNFSLVLNQQTITRLGRGRPFWIVLCSLCILLIEAALRLTPAGLEHWHYILHRSYYLPIIVAGLTLGWMGGLAAAVLSSFSYLAHSQSTESPDALNTLDRFLETTIFALVGVLAGVLADRERKQRKKAEATAAELGRVYQELQNNVEHVKRAARMSALGHLSAGLAHEIRNPLASIEGAATIVQREPDNLVQRTEFLAIIQEESRRLNKLVTNFLDFARPRPPEFRPTDMGSLVQSMCSLISQTTPRNDITFNSQIESGLPPLPCDSEQLKQVILNILLNSVQAMPNGGEVSVTVRKENNFLTIQISDQGTGIPPADVDSIFDPFFTTKETGTGLGLPVAYQIISAHGGELKLERSSNDGATFAVRLPYRNQVS